MYSDFGAAEGDPQIIRLFDERRGIRITRTRPDKAFDKNFALAFVCNVNVIANLAFFLFYNRYLEGLGASKTQIGLYMGAFALGAVMVRPTAGMAIDKYGRKRLIYIGLALMLVATGGYFALDRISWTILAVRVLHGAGFGCYITGIFTIVTDAAPAPRRAKVIAVFGLSGMVTFGVIPIVAEFVIESFGFRTLFSISLLTLAVAMIIAQFVKASAPKKADSPSIGFVGLLRRAELFIPLGALFVFCTGMGALVNFIAVYLESKSVGIGWFFLASSAAGMFVRLGFGHLADEYGRRRVAVPSFAAGALALFWLGVFTFPLELLVCGLLWGAGVGLAAPAVGASVIDGVEPQDRGKGIALFTASFDLGIMTGSFVYGAVAERYGYSWMYLIASAATLAAAVIARFFKN